MELSRLRANEAGAIHSGEDSVEEHGFEPRLKELRKAYGRFKAGRLWKGVLFDGIAIGLACETFIEELGFKASEVKPYPLQSGEIDTGVSHSPTRLW